MGSSIQIIVEVLIFGAVVLLFFGIVREVEQAYERRRRLGIHGAMAPILTQSLFANEHRQSKFAKWVQESTSISDSMEREKLRRQLMLAGFSAPSAPVWYVTIRFSLALALPLLFLSFQYLSTQPATGFALIMWPLFLCGIGLIAPSAFLNNRANARQNQLEFEFPDALDLMVVCVEAGLSLDAAFVRIGHEIFESHPRIGEEFQRVSDQLRAGRARSDALRAMADRTGVKPIKSFAALLIQTEILGSSIAQTLRTYSSEMRQTRFLKAEEKAMRIPVVMTVPLVLCILPVIITAAMLPAGLDLVRNVMPAISGHK